MKKLFSQRRISSNSNLPENFLTTIEEYTAANGVLFVDLDPVLTGLFLWVCGLNLLLKSGEFMWAIDETFDAGHANIIAGSVYFGKKSVRALSIASGVVQSPRILQICCLNILDPTNEVI